MNDIKKSELERAFLTLYLQLGQDLPRPVEEYRFSRTRRFRFDFALPRFKIGIELQGGSQGYPVKCHNCGVQVRSMKNDGTSGKVIRIPGHHAKPMRFKADMEKTNLAQLEGWILLVFGTDDVYNKAFEMVDTIRHAVQRRCFYNYQSVELSERELEVLALVAGGFKSKDIALRLECKDNTISSHIDNILQKLNATNRIHAVAVALASGLILPDDIPWASRKSVEEIIDEMV